MVGPDCRSPGRRGGDTTFEDYYTYLPKQKGCKRSARVSVIGGNTTITAFKLQLGWLSCTVLILC